MWAFSWAHLLPPKKIKSLSKDEGSYQIQLELPTHGNLAVRCAFGDCSRPVFSEQTFVDCLLCARQC